MNPHRAPDEITAGEIIEALAMLSITRAGKARSPVVARVEQTGGGVATVFVVDDAGRDVLAIGPGRYDWSDPLASVFLANLRDTTLGYVDGTSAEPYFFREWTDEVIREVVAQALYDLSEREGAK